MVTLQHVAVLSLQAAASFLPRKCYHKVEMLIAIIQLFEIYIAEEQKTGKGSRLYTNCSIIS